MRIAVIGTGPAGCAAAISLRQQGRQVTLIGDGQDGVGEQLHPAARPLLDQLGIPNLDAQLPCVGTRSAWDSWELTHQDFLSHPFGNGWLLDRATFGHQLRQAAIAAGARPRIPSRLVDLWPEGTQPAAWVLQLSDGTTTCDWVVDATGRRATVARRLGIKRRVVDRQIAMVGWLTTPQADDVDETLTVERTNSGWWYSCRLPGRRRVAGLITTHRLEPRQWESQLRATRHLGPLVRNYSLEGDVIARPANSTMLEKCYGERWLAIGDAAVSFDPLASRGIVSALQSGLQAASLVGASNSQLAAWQAELASSFQHYCAERARFVDTNHPPNA